MKNISTATTTEDYDAGGKTAVSGLEITLVKSGSGDSGDGGGGGTVDPTPDPTTPVLYDPSTWTWKVGGSGNTYYTALTKTFTFDSAETPTGLGINIGATDNAVVVADYDRVVTKVKASTGGTVRLCIDDEGTDSWVDGQGGYSYVDIPVSASTEVREFAIDISGETATFMTESQRQYSLVGRIWYNTTDNVAATLVLDDLYFEKDVPVTAREGGYTVGTQNINITAANGVITAAGCGKIRHRGNDIPDRVAAEVTLTVVADAGYSLLTVAANSGESDVPLTLNPDGTYTFTMPTEGDVTVTATFDENTVAVAPSGEPEETAEAVTTTYTLGERVITVCVTKSGTEGALATHGTIAVSGSGKPSEAVTVTLVATPDAGYELTSLSAAATAAASGTPMARKAAADPALTGVTSSGDNVYTYVINPGENTTITAEFAALDPLMGAHKILINPCEHGTVVASHTSANENETVSLTVTPDAGYKLHTLTIIERAQGTDGAVADVDYDPTKPMAIPAADGTTLPIDDGATVEWTIAADGTYQFTMPNIGVEITATFIEIPYAPTISYDQPTRVITIALDARTSADKAAKLHYSVDGGSSWSESTTAVTLAAITANTVVQAYATWSGDDTNPSATISATCRVAVMPAIGYTRGNNVVTLTLGAATATNTADAIIYYTTDGTDPTTESNSVSATTDIVLDQSMATVKAFAVDAEGNYSVLNAVAVQYAFTLTVGTEWATFYAPFSFEVPSGVEAYTMTSVDYTPASGTSGTVTLKQQAHVVKETPMLLRNVTDGQQTTTFTVYHKSDAALQEGTYTTSNFKGTLEDIELNAAGSLYYILNAGRFLRSWPGTLPKYNCYLEFPESTTSSDETSAQSISAVRSFVLRFENGMSTGLDIITLGEAEPSAVWHTLTGSAVARPAYPGVYIHNGKKVLVR